MSEQLEQYWDWLLHTPVVLNERDRQVQEQERAVYPVGLRPGYGGPL